MGAHPGPLRAGWKAQRAAKHPGALYPRDIPGTALLVLGLCLTAAPGGWRACAWMLGTFLAVYVLLRLVIATLRRELGAELREVARLVGELCAALRAGDPRRAWRRPFRDMEDFNSRWSRLALGVWVAWIALLLAPFLTRLS